MDIFDHILSSSILMNNYFMYHLHTELSLLDSCTNYKLYIDKAKELGMTALCFSEHGNIYNWFEKMQYCEKNGLKYVHGCEVYLTEKLYHEKEEVDKNNNKIIKTYKERDNYHTVLIAKNIKGFYELNDLLFKSTDDDHTYYKNRISFDEFLNISDNIISTSACLQSPLNKLNRDNDYYERLIKKYDYLEIQPHYNSQEQIEYNNYLVELSRKYNKPLIVGTDTHSLNKYKSECAKILKKRKNIKYANEDDFDLTMKSYEELYDMLKRQGLSDTIIEESLNNTKILENSTDVLKMDKSFKYPDLYENEEELFLQKSYEGLNKKIKNNEIKKEDYSKYDKRIQEEFVPYKKTGMLSFMLFMSELINWCHDNGIPTSPSRGSCGGSEIASLLGITDLDAIEWHTIFSRFVNEYRVSLGDIDIDFPPDSRDKVYEYIIERFGYNKTCYILTTNTISDKGTIDDIVGALYMDTMSKSEYVRLAKDIKQLYESNSELAIKKYPNVFYYFDGLKGTVVSQGIHPAGIVASPITLSDHIGLHWYDGKIVSQINMDEIHDLNYVKYDILGLKNVAVIRDTCKYIGQDYPKTSKFDFNDEKVWKDIITSPYGIFQFEGKYAFDLLKKFKPLHINDLSLVNASLRPSGASYRDRLINGEFNHNPSKEIDEMLKANKGFLVFQEDTLKFLMDVCGYNGGEADNLRRAIGNKDKKVIEENLPRIINGYHKHSNKSREQAEKEVEQFLQILIDSSSYQFGYNHSTGYSMLGYMCGYYRYYYPLEFTCSLLNNADNMEDTVSGIELAKLKNIKILSPKFGYSSGKNMPLKATNSIYKGIGSIKEMNIAIGDELYQLSQNNKYDSFIDLLIDITTKTSCKKNQIEILIKLDFFDCFGKSKKLLDIYEYFKLLYNKKAPKITTIERDILDKNMIKHIKNNSTPTNSTYSKLDWCNTLLDIWSDLKNTDIPIKDKLSFQTEILGYIDYKNPKLNKRYVLVSNLNTKYTPRIDTYCLANGNTCNCKIAKKLFTAKEIKETDIIFIHKMQKKFGYKKVGETTDKRGKIKPIFEEDETKIEWWITDYDIVNIDEVLDEIQ